MNAMWRGGEGGRGRGEVECEDTPDADSKVVMFFKRGGDVACVVHRSIANADRAGLLSRALFAVGVLMLVDLLLLLVSVFEPLAGFVLLD